MDLSRLLGYGLMASSSYFLWLLAPMAVLFPYGLVTGGGGSGGIDFTNDGFYRFIGLNMIPGTALLTSGMYVLKRSKSPKLAKRIAVAGMVVIVALAALIITEAIRMETCVQNKKNAFLEMMPGYEISEHDEISMRLACTEQDALDAEIDRIGLVIVRLQIENSELANPPISEEAQEAISQNNKDIDELLILLDALSSPTPTVDIPYRIKAQMESAMDALKESDLPVYALNINSSTGILDIRVESEANIDDEIRQITGDLPIDIIYGTNTFRLQEADEYNRPYA